MHERLRALDFYPGRQVRALDFIRADRVRIPQQAGNFFSYASFLCYDFHVIRWGLIRDSILFSQKWLCVVINDELLENGECYLALLLSIICLRRLCIACRNILTPGSSPDIAVHFSHHVTIGAQFKLAWRGHKEFWESNRDKSKLSRGKCENGGQIAHW